MKPIYFSKLSLAFLLFAGCSFLIFGLAQGSMPQSEVIFYLPFGPDTRSPGNFPGVYVSSSGLLYEQDYLNAGISTVHNAGYCDGVDPNVFCDGYYYYGQYHGERGGINPHTSEERGALDFVITEGIPVLASADGTVHSSTNTCEVYISHEDGSVTGYLHLSKVLVRPGNPIERGDPIGLSGDEGPAPTCQDDKYGDHLHFVRMTNWREMKVSFADSSVQDHGGIVRPSVFRGNSTLRFYYQADGVVPDDGDDPTSDLPFSDVPPSHTFFGYIMALYFNGAVNGYGDGTFRPDDALTRGAAAKIIIIAAGEEQAYSDGECAFDDVCPGHTFYTYIRRLKELGWTAGCGNNNYCPDNLLPRGAMAKFVVLAHDGAEPDDCNNSPFPDVPEGHTFCPYIQRLKEIFDAKGISVGYPDGTFHPDENITRGGASKFVVVGVDLEYWVPPFPDVLPDNPFYQYIKAMKERGITDGYSDGTYKPDNALTRDAATKFVTRGLGATPNYQDGRQTFPDVPPGHLFYQYVEYLVEIGAVSGYSDGLFHPSDPTTRGQIAKIIVQALAYQGVVCDYNLPQAFSDVPPSHTFYTYIQCLKELNITDGFSDGTYRPDNALTRGQAAKFIYRAFLVTTPDVLQEATEASNDDPATAPIQGRFDPEAEYNNEGSGGDVPGYTIPDGDEDYVRFEAQAGQSYKITTVGIGLHLALQAQVFASVNDIGANNPVPAIYGNQGRELFSIWQADSNGMYYIRLTNNSPYATEGDSTNIRIEAVDLVISQLYLPAIVRK